MNILHVIPNLKKGGAERLVLDLCQALQSRSEVTLKIVLLHPENAYEFLAQELNIEVIPAYVVPSIMGKARVDVTALENVVADFKPDVIHAHLFESVMVLSQINLRRAKLFVHFHDNMVQFQNFELKTLFTKRLFTNFYEKRTVLKSWRNKQVHVIAISADVQRYARHVLPNEVKIHLLKNAIDLDRFKPQEVQKIPNSLCMIGSLVPKKGQALAIRTVAVLNKRGERVQLDLLGDGPDRNQLLELAVALGVENQVFFRGNVDHPEEFLHTCMIYVHTALYEPFGLAILEAMACGLPVVCTNGKGNAELIASGKTGFLVDSQDPEILADHVASLLHDKDMYALMSDNATRFAQAYGIEQYASQILELYRS